jgi:deoxyribonuclease V
MSTLPTPTFACVDVDYRAAAAVTACVGFTAWSDAVAAYEHVRRAPGAPADYEPGAFYRRELPHLLDALAELPVAPTTIIVDGYVWLAPDRPGLGAHLHDALGGRAVVIGVAKRSFAGNTAAVPIVRGGGSAPLYVTAAGVDAATAATAIAAMHGPYRIPTLLKRADRLARDG